MADRVELEDVYNAKIEWIKAQDGDKLRLGARTSLCFFFLVVRIYIYTLIQ